MKVPESLLREYVQTSMSIEEIGDLLTMTGFEVEEITTIEGEKVLDVNVMANRGDGASVIGLAREILAKDLSSSKTDLYERAEVRFHSADEYDLACGELASVTIETENCARYACRVFLDVKNGDSPTWLQERLRRMGQRPISLLVDLTNYVMFETGQPLHAFDLDKLAGQRIIVRQARKDETIFVTLDETQRKITPKDMVICDADRPVAIAGIMGGLHSEVGSGTKRMLLESASFDHRCVRNTRTRLGLATEASYRFERYVDPEQVVAALNRFAELYEQITGALPVRGVVDNYPGRKENEAIPLRMSRCNRLLGLVIEQSEAEDYLSRLGFTVAIDDGTLRCTPPSWRNDVLREDDLIEEVGRVHGYEKIPETLPKGETTRGGVFGADAMIDRVREELLRCGLTQTISHSLRDLHPLDAAGGRVRVRSPHSPEIAHLRNSNLPCLADAAQRNGLDDLRLFEIGKVFAPGVEHFDLSILLTGGGEKGKATSDSDFFAMKGIVERIAACIDADASVRVPEVSDDRLHPTRQAAIIAGGVQVGTFGQIHPLVAEASGLRSITVLASLDLSELVSSQPRERHLRALSKNPAVRRDIAIVIKKSVPFSQVSITIEAACGEVLEKQWLFDVFEGKGIEPGFHSLAIALQLRKQGANFTDEEANQVRDRAVAALEPLGARQR